MVAVLACSIHLPLLEKIMALSNFRLLQPHWPSLYEHARFAESYAYSDPQTAVIKLRCFAEVLVGIIFQDLRLPSEPGDGFFEKLKSPNFQDLVGPAILQKLHAVFALLGNKAAHGRPMNAQTSLYLIEESYMVGQWFYRTYSGDISGHYPPYLPPEPAARPTETPDDLTRQLAEAKAQLSAFGGLRSRRPRLRSPPFINRRTRQRSGISRPVRGKPEFDRFLASTAIHRQIGIRDAFSEFDLSDGQSGTGGSTCGVPGRRCAKRLPPQGLRGHRQDLRHEGFDGVFPCHRAQLRPGRTDGQGIQGDRQQDQVRGVHDPQDHLFVR